MLRRSAQTGRRSVQFLRRCLDEVERRRLLRRAVVQISRNRREAIDPRLVVLVADSASSRVCKIGFGLRAIGWKTVLLHSGSLPSNPAKCFDESLLYSSPSEALLMGSRYRPAVYHVFSNWNFEVASFFVRYRPGKIVFDDYDVLGGTLLPSMLRTYRSQVVQERFCLENADGLSCRDLETQCVKRMGYRLRGRRLLLLDFCWGEPVPDIPRWTRGREFRIVNCGNIPVRTQAEITSHCADLINLAKKLVAQSLNAGEIHFHVYPVHPIWPEAPRRGAGQEIGLGDTQVFLHLHERVQPDELQKQLVQYDAGLYHFDVPFHNPPTYNHSKFEYTSGNRVFDYLDAGLPVIIHGSKFMEYVTRQVHADIRVESGVSANARDYLSGADVLTLRQNAALGAERLGIVRHAPKLAAFYDSLSGEPVQDCTTRPLTVVGGVA